MAKKESTPKGNDSSKGQVRKEHKIGDQVVPMAWQPSRDRTTTPPKRSNDKKDK